ncbi:MAG: hypothetical protein V6Z89_03520 [Desulfobacter sp.]
MTEELKGVAGVPGSYIRFYIAPDSFKNYSFRFGSPAQIRTREGDLFS